MMLLTKEHISAFQINWNDKASNLRLLAKKLNIALNSMVFVDDSEYEINLVKRYCPEVEVLHLPIETQENNVEKLIDQAYFDKLILSNEDSIRHHLYRSQAQRTKLEESYNTIDDYLNELQAALSIKFIAQQDIPRVAQLTQKTNQFNMTTKRYTKADIQTIIDSDHHDIIVFNLQDRFGDLGLIGLVIIEHNYLSKCAVLDTFLMSCRALGRKVEHVVLDCCLQYLKEKKHRSVIGTHVETPRNQLVKEFYLQHGFQPILCDDKKTRKHLLALNNHQPYQLNYFLELNQNICSFSQTVME